MWRGRAREPSDADGNRKITGDGGFSRVHVVQFSFAESLSTIFEIHSRPSRSFRMQKFFGLLTILCLFSLPLWSQATPAKAAAGSQPTATIDTTVGKLSCKLF